MNVNVVICGRRREEGFLSRKRKTGAALLRSTSRCDVEVGVAEHEEWSSPDLHLLVRGRPWPSHRRGRLGLRRRVVGRRWPHRLPIGFRAWERHCLSCCPPFFPTGFDLNSRALSIPLPMIQITQFLRVQSLDYIFICMR